MLDFAAGGQGGADASAFADRARALRLPFTDVIHPPPEGLLPANPEAVRRGAIALACGADPHAFIAPRQEALAPLAALLRRAPELRSRITVTTPAAIRTALMEGGAGRFLPAAVRHLQRRFPVFSAATTFTGGQLAAGAGMALLLLAASVFWREAVLLGVTLAVAMLFGAVTVLRFVAAALVEDRRGAPRLRAAADGELPVYSVLVPIRDEAAVLPELIAALSRLDWPADRLNIKIIVEADDAATLAAARWLLPGPPFELVVVPVGQPRTKPKALAYALPFARGDFVTIYDAEDRPHAAQLREAHARFAAAGPALACLQAPLVVDNEADSLVALMFATEYAALFGGLLPALSRLRLPMPLGGTSNHFRRAALDAVGGWDPFNVTEDADLGIRLARFGYRTEMIRSPTVEEAPVTGRAWLAQRTRWFKGWMQTWLVHMRHPVRLYRDLGLRQFVGFHLMVTALILSSLIHPVYLLVLLAAVADPTWVTADESFISQLNVGLALFNLVGGYAAMAALSRQSLKAAGRGHLAYSVVFLPAYWLAMSLAAYKALFDLFLRPHFWGKTPHRGRGGRLVRLQCPPVTARSIAETRRAVFGSSP